MGLFPIISPSYIVSFLHVLEPRFCWECTELIWSLILIVRITPHFSKCLLQILTESSGSKTRRNKVAQASKFWSTPHTTHVIFLFIYKLKGTCKLIRPGESLGTRMSEHIAAGFRSIGPTLPQKASLFEGCILTHINHVCPPTIHHVRLFPTLTMGHGGRGEGGLNDSVAGIRDA